MFSNSIDTENHFLALLEVMAAQVMVDGTGFKGMGAGETGEPPLCNGVARHSDWPQAREAHLRREPRCVITGATKLVQVHHKLPVSWDKSQELNPENLVTLRADLHLLLGHFGDWRSANLHIDIHIPMLRSLIANRPYKNRSKEDGGSSALIE